MAGIIYDATGTSITFATTGLTLAVESIELGPEDEKKEIDVTTLANTGVRTKKLSVLSEIKDFSITAQHNPANQYAAWAPNELITITFPSGSGSIVLYGAKKSYKPGDGKAQEKGMCTISIMVSNLNGSGVETAPVKA